MILRSLAATVALAFLSGAAAAQGVSVTPPPRVPSAGGSFVATAAGATVGAVAGLTLGAALAPRGDGYCVTSPGGGCSSSASGPTIAFVFGSTVLGAAGGAMLGRHVTHGRQSVPHTLVGAAVGLLAGAWITWQLHVEEPLPVVMALSIPTGFFAALSGW